MTLAILDIHGSHCGYECARLYDRVSERRHVDTSNPLTSHELAVGQRLLILLYHSLSRIIGNPEESGYIMPPPSNTQLMTYNRLAETVTSVPTQARIRAVCNIFLNKKYVPNTLFCGCLCLSRRWMQRRYLHDKLQRISWLVVRKVLCVILTPALVFLLPPLLNGLYKAVEI